MGQAELALQCIAGIAISNGLSKGLNIKMDGGGELCLHGETKILKLERKIAEKLSLTFDTNDFSNLVKKQGGTLKMLAGLIHHLKNFDYFPIQNLEKISPRRSSALKTPVIEPNSDCAWRKSSASRSKAGTVEAS